MRHCCHLYNAAVEQRRHFLKGGRSIRYLAEQNQLPDINRGIPEYKRVYSQVLQDTLRRVDRAFTSFFERAGLRRSGRRVKAGFPRFKPDWRYNSFTYPQAKNYMIIGGHVTLPKIGRLRVFMHRDPIGEIKTMTVKRDRVGDWYIILTAEVQDVPRQEPSRQLASTLA